MFVHPQPFLDVALRQRPWRKMPAPGVRSETFNGAVAQADAKRTHVVHMYYSALRLPRESGNAA